MLNWAYPDLDLTPPSSCEQEAAVSEKPLGMPSRQISIETLADSSSSQISFHSLSSRTMAIIPAKPGIDENISSNANTMFDNAGTQIYRESGKAGSPNTNAEMLLGALRNVITSLLRTADAENKGDGNPYTLGPDGEEFIITLQTFMSSFLQSRRGPVGGVEVELKGKKPDMPNAGPTASNTSHDDLSPKDVADVLPVTKPPPDAPLPEENTRSQEGAQPIKVHEETPDSSEVTSIGLMRDEDADAFDPRKQQFLEKALKALREHIFNALPIRLLCFKPHGSKLQITLIERGAVYTHIAPILKTTIYDSDIFPPCIINVFGRRETDEEAIVRLISEYSRYAILSHTWLRGGSGEITYGDWNRGEFDARQLGYQKLVNFCRAAWEDHGVTFGWMDTVCINKESSSELDESIRSMYKWYRDAYICITYLAETVALSDMPNDSWFTRGWTLQELFAPFRIKFYNAYWNKLVESSENDKEDSIILKQIEQATTITADELGRCTEYPSLISISRRMQMAATRQVTREEDSSYCLMGIFDVSISIAYGEGFERAFSRLLQEILNSNHRAGDMFNWAGTFGAPISELFPRTPQGYLHRSTDAQLELNNMPIEPLILTHLGLRITIVVMLAILIQNPQLQYNPIGDYHAMAHISSLEIYSDQLLDRGYYSVLDTEISGHGYWKNDYGWQRLTFGVLNVGGDDQTIFIPKHCLAIILRCSMNSYSKDFTEAPIVFTLDKKSGPDRGELADDTAWNDCYSIEQSELDIHGMKLSTVYL